VRVLDVRGRVRTHAPRYHADPEAYRAGHIPGAVFVDLESEGLSKSGTGGGRHPLPDREAFEAAVREAGVNRDSLVVVYDDQNGFTACRLWWTLRYFGHDDVRVLDGGFPAWVAEGEPVSTEAPPGRQTKPQMRPASSAP
jgi:thiosulfate/3-mercaptopyruvate sulfurtransferase